MGNEEVEDLVMGGGHASVPLLHFMEVSCSVLARAHLKIIGDSTVSLLFVYPGQIQRLTDVCI